MARLMLPLLPLCSSRNRAPPCPAFVPVPPSVTPALAVPAAGPIPELGRAELTRSSSTSSRNVPLSTRRTMLLPPLRLPPRAPLEDALAKALRAGMRAGGQPMLALLKPAVRKALPELKGLQFCGAIEALGLPGSCSSPSSSSMLLLLGSFRL